MAPWMKTAPPSPRRDRIGQRDFRLLMGQILLAGEEVQEWSALLRDVVADRAPAASDSGPRARRMATQGFSGSNTEIPSARAAPRRCWSEETSRSIISRPCKSRATAN